MKYRVETTSIQGFIQQIACSYLRHGYWFYVRGSIPPDKDPFVIDEKLLSKYKIAVSESTRARRKKGGRANLQLIRHQNVFVIMATKGIHPFFELESKTIRDIRHTPLQYAGYSVSYKPGGRKKDGSRDDKWHAHVALTRSFYLDLKATFTERAKVDSAERLALAFYELSVAPYAPIRRQLLTIHREVNRIRKIAGRTQIPTDVLPLRRKVVRPFERPIYRQTSKIR
ncbi:hypothetical protein Poly51_34400 [Rubripirellula tenax]|uniref:Uncharacterized protein n=1 Tax=Rubripirellula tenax TaxID=2528015 RepID=A0A5C6F5H5_9BACT|nr:hypothetical protein [Rubripirellula tenax]TWU54721.1 hypothetical protein Poly51_34400 [Rubripirellula tenax]